MQTSTIRIWQTGWLVFFAKLRGDVFMLIFLGALPQPLHGMSSINRKMLERFRTGKVTAFNLVPSYAARFYPGVLFTVLKMIHLAVMFFPYLLTLWRNRYSTNIYFSIAGGSGKVFDWPFMFAAGYWAKSIYVHHHSFAYCNADDALFRQLLRAGKGRIIHIALCENMKESLTQRYNIPQDMIEVLSNAAFFTAESSTHVRENVSCLGFISNISFDKGIREFVETFRLLKKEHPHLHALIAGPCLDNEVQAFIDKSCEEIASLQYRGKVYGRDKETFFANIDVLLFPTSYVNEAEPLTIYEAFASNVPVIAWARGCIPAMIREGGGEAIDTETAFSSAAVKTLSAWLDQPSQYRKQVDLARQRFSIYQKQMYTRRDVLIQRILDTSATRQTD